MTKLSTAIGMAIVVLVFACVAAGLIDLLVALLRLL